MYESLLAGWNWVVACFEAIPDTLVGVVVGSIFTLSGVVLTNRTNLANLRVQLEHDAVQRNKERSLSMRRDAYLGAAEAIAAALGAVARFGDLEIAHAELMGEYHSKTSQIAKIHVVATEDTAIKFAEFMRALAEVFIDLSIRRRELLDIKEEMQAYQSQVRNHQASRDRFLESMKQHNIEGTMDQRRSAVLQENFDFEGKCAEEAATAHDELLQELRPQLAAFVERCQVEELRLNAKLIPLIASVRNDLEQPIDPQRYAEVFSAEPVITRAHLNQLFRVEASDKHV